jgi:anti-sigma regulatory factor (Ser/Thr protein kinase)
MVGEAIGEVIGQVVQRGPAPPARLRTDDAGVVSDADAAVADLLGCRVRDLVGKPFVVFLDEPMRRPWFAALRDARIQHGAGHLHGGLRSRDPVRLRAVLALASGRSGVEVTISEVERAIDTDRLFEHLRRVGERQHTLAGTLDAVTRPRSATLPDLDVGVEPSIDDTTAATPALNDWRALPSGEVLMLVIAAHGQEPLHAEMARSIRETVRALVLAGTPPGELFARVEHICGLRGAGPMASAVAAYWAPDGHRASVVSVGGAAPLVRRADGTVARIASPAPALGSHAGAPSSLVNVELGCGDTLVLHADATGEAQASAGSERLERRLASLEPRELGGASTARLLLDPATPRGTAAVLCAVRGSRELGAGSPGNQAQIGLGKDELRDIARSREHLASWLERRAVRAETIERALIVISELVTNAVAAASDRAELRVSVSRGAVLVEVSDDGSSWHPEAAISPGPDGGHGLRVASALCEELHVASSAAGTVIRARVGARSMR